MSPGAGGLPFAHLTRALALIPALSMGLIIALGAATIAWAQVDPAWLRSWNEAWEARPETMTTLARIAAEDEPGTPFQIRGRVEQPDGTPAIGTIVHAYHRDADGFDFGPGDQATTTWRLQGWARTDADGRFGFDTVRPAPDALGREAAHVHFTLVSYAHGRQWATKIYLADDPLVPPAARARSGEAGAYGAVRAVRDVVERPGTQAIEVAFRLKPEGDF